MKWLLLMKNQKHFDRHQQMQGQAAAFLKIAIILAGKSINWKACSNQFAVSKEAIIARGEGSRCF